MRLINQTAETLAKLYHIKYSLSRNDSTKLKEAVAAVLEEFIIPDSPDIPDSEIALSTQPSSSPEASK